MKTKIFMAISLVMFALNAFAYETWHTPSGKSYDVYVSSRVGRKGKASAFYVISYKTEQKLSDSHALLSEFHDLLTHLYYFHIPEKLRNNKSSSVTVEAFREVPKSAKDKNPSRRYTKRLSELKWIVQNHKNMDMNRLKALENFNQKKYKQAISFFKKVKGKVAHDYTQTANAYILLGKKDEALKELEAGVKKYPTDMTLLNNLAMTTMLGGAYLLEGKYEYDPQRMEKAKKILDKALKLDRDNWLTTSNMAVLETTVQNFKAAEGLYLKALKLSGESPELSYRVGDFYHQQKEFKKAERHYRNAMEGLNKGRSPAAAKRMKDIQQRLKLVLENRPLK